MNTKINAKLSNLQLSKVKKATKNNEEVTLRLGLKNFNKNELPHELLSSVKWTALAHPSRKLNKTTSLPKPSGPF